MRILDLALKDLSQIFRDKRSLLFLVVMPIAFTFFMGCAYRGAAESADTDNRIVLVVINPEPDALLNKMLLGRLDLSEDIRAETMSEADAMAAFYQGEAAGVPTWPHLLRHRFASELVRQGVDSRTWIELMNHEDGSLMRRYAAVHDENLRAAVEAL